MIPRKMKKIVGAFQGCKNLQSVIFEQGSELTEISDNAFRECKSLKSIVLPNKLREIGWGAFNQSGLTEVKIPKSVKCIGELSFFHCSSLSTVVFE